MKAFCAFAAFVSVLPAGAWQTYTVQHTPGQDDIPALAAALATGNFSSNTTILFKKGVTYNAWTAIKFPSFTNVEVAIEGNITYPEDIATVQGMKQDQTF